VSRVNLAVQSPRLSFRGSSAILKDRANDSHASFPLCPQNGVLSNFDSPAEAPRQFTENRQDFAGISDYFQVGGYTPET
jgi:hypothetical protein